MYRCAIVAVLAYLSVLSPAFAEDEHQGHYSCPTVPDMPVKLRSLVTKVAHYPFPTYQDFCDLYVKSAVAKVRARPAPERGVINWATGHDLDAASQNAQLTAPIAYANLELAYLHLTRRTLGDTSISDEMLRADFALVSSDLGDSATQESAQHNQVEPFATPGPPQSPGVPAVRGSSTSSDSHTQGCPINSYPWRDEWGNRTCKSFGSGQTLTTEANPATGCPTGSYPWTDSWGNRICKAFGSDKTYYDTSKGCPIGTHPWNDEWGNPTCKPF